MTSPKRAQIPLGIRWVLWLEHVPKALHRPIGCVVACSLPLFAFAYLLALVLGFSRGVSDGCWHLLRWASVTTPRRLVGMGALVGAGLAFYWLRARHRLFYAWIEITVAITGMWLGIESAARSRTASLSLAMGSVYLLVRGFDNAALGKKEAATKYAARVSAAAPAILAEVEALKAREAAKESSTKV
jgi:hypothetical protein